MKKNILKTNLVCLSLTLINSVGMAASCPTGAQASAVNGRQMIDKLFVNSSHCGFSNRYVAIRNAHVSYFDNQIKLTNSFYGDNGERIEGNLNTIEFNLNGSVSSADCEQTAAALTQLESAQTDAQLDQAILQSPLYSANSVAGCGSSSVAPANPAQPPPTSIAGPATVAPSTAPAPATTAPVTAIPAVTQPATNAAPLTTQPATTAVPSAIAPATFALPVTAASVNLRSFPDYNVGTGALKIVASLYSSINGIDR